MTKYNSINYRVEQYGEGGRFYVIRQSDDFCMTSKLTLAKAIKWIES